MIPPMVMWIKIQWFGMWVPLFLLWPIVLVLLLIALPFVFLGMLIAGRISRFWQVIRLVLAAYGMVSSLRGLRIDIHREDKIFEIYIP